MHIFALVFVYVFAISERLSTLQYNLIKVDFGWINTTSFNLWYLLFYIFAFLSSLFSLYIVRQWKKEKNIRIIAKQTNFFYITLIAALSCGALLDIFLSASFRSPLPRMTSIFVFVPAGSMYFLARHYNVMDLKSVYEKDMIATEEDSRAIFKNMSIALYISAVLTFMAEYMPYTNLAGSFRLALIKGLTLIIVGLLIQLAQNINDRTVRDNLTLMVLVLSIPIATLQYSKYGGLTVWPFPMIIMISAIVFSKRTLLITSFLVAVFTQVIMWLFRPETITVLNKFDYILRIGLLVVAFATGIYINRLYGKKIKENKDQIDFQKMDSNISYEFLMFNRSNYDDKINYLLKELGEFFEVDRTYIFTLNRENDTATYSHEWTNHGINPEVGSVDSVPTEYFPWWLSELESKGQVYIEDVLDMPREAKGEQEQQEQLIRQEIKSLASVPIVLEDEIQAFIGFDSVKSIRKWTEDEMSMLNIMANILSSGLSQIKSDQEIEHMAYYDPLTNLPNRFLFNDRVKQAIKQSERTGKFIAVIFIDLDGFKAVNDSIGHSGGDSLLQKVGNQLSKNLRKIDTVARFGGGEFLVLVNNIADYSRINRIADDIMKAFDTPFKINTEKFTVTASAGIAMYPVDGKDADTLVKNADIAMYKSKEKGRNQSTLCTKEMKEEMHVAFKLSQDLKRAIAKNELTVYYQPQIDLLKNKIIGVEALLRWFHPTQGLISPSIFIPLAEKTNLIHSIDEWVFKTATKQNKKWQDMGLEPIEVAVNLSASQMINPGISKRIKEILEETGLDPKYVELEITESAIIKDSDDVMKVLNKLKEIGITIAIDDFGTEYSSLSRLKLLPMDRIKIDMQFVQGIDDNAKDRAITLTIIDLAKSLNVSVLAERVETLSQLEFLRENGCDVTQGYYHYKPMTAETLEKILFDLSR